MKKIFTFIVILTVSLNMQAQEKMYIWQNGVKTSFVVAEVDSITFEKENTPPTPPTTGTKNGYEWVDLGLSVKWATCNVGANKPEEYGDYFAWGEINSKEVYTLSTYIWSNGASNLSSSSLTKYNNDKNLGSVDYKMQLELSDDAARAHWGGSWRTPSIAEWRDLWTFCSWKWTTQNGVNGYKVTSKNGNSIFLPAAGCRNKDYYSGQGTSGLYWSNELVSDSPWCVVTLSLTSDNLQWVNPYRSRGQSVRPVCQ